MKRFIKNLLKYVIRHLETLLPDKLYLQIRYYKRFHKFCDFNNPITYNEKLQWLKLYDRKPEYTSMVDKFEVKKIVADKIGKEYIIPTLGVWNSFDDIDFEQLPKQFVLKCTHDSGGLVIVKDKSNFERKEAKNKIMSSLKRNYYWHGREWAYKNIKPRIIAEQYLSSFEGQELVEYKIFCFNGIPKIFMVCKGKGHSTERTNDFYDMNFELLPFTNGHPNSNKIVEKPKNFEKMEELAKKLSEGIPQVRVDFYDVNGKIYFGELTFFHWGGMMPFNPPEWDRKIGEWIQLSNKMEGK